MQPRSVRHQTVKKQMPWSSEGKGEEGEVNIRVFPLRKNHEYVSFLLGHLHPNLYRDNFAVVK